MIRPRYNRANVTISEMVSEEAESEAPELPGIQTKIQVELSANLIPVARVVGIA